MFKFELRLKLVYQDPCGRTIFGGTLHFIFFYLLEGLDHLIPSIIFSIKASGVHLLTSIVGKKILAYGKILNNILP